MKRDELIDKGYELAREMAGGGTPTTIMVRQMFEEFTRKLADRVTEKPLSYGSPHDNQRREQGK